tara:strand:+ start:3264 stop:4046 length:783 start_codon:yes stop_codon:yes gene_type:complete
MNKIYVVGNKTSKSLSPLIFNYWFSKYNIKAKYEFLEVNEDSFNKEIKTLLKNRNTLGLNVTIPFKKKILSHLDWLDPHAKKIQAANFVINGQRIKGYNTDWIGYYNSIKKIISLRKQKVLLIGYGGAAQSIHYLLKSKKLKNVVIFNRTKRKILFETKTKYTKFKNLEKYLPVSDLIINTTPTNPIKPNMVKLIRSETVLSEIVYNPRMTKFLKYFPDNKKNYGIDMLLEQAIPCFEKLFGFIPSIDSKLVKLLDAKIN